MEYTKSGDKYVIRLLKDEDLFEQLEKFAKEEKLTAGHVTGIGALKDIELGYYNLEEKKYYKKIFHEDYELLSMSGNLSLLDNKEFFHLHLVISDHEYRCFGGHLFSAKVAVTVEVYFSPVELSLNRTFDSCTGLNLWDVNGQ